MAAENLVVAKAVPEVLRAVALFAPPAWTRLEPQSVTGDPAPGLTAALHDPLWLLGRQWQMAEFRGEDAGMPIAVRIATEMQRVTAWQPGDPAANKPARALPADQPLDPWVEREPPAAAGPGLLQRAEAGATLVAFPHGCSYRRRLLEWLAGAGVSPGRTLDLGSYHAIIACVAAGAGVAIVPAEVLDQAVMASVVERHPLPARLRVNRTHLVWSGEASASLRALIELLPKPRGRARAQA